MKKNLRKTSFSESTKHDYGIFGPSLPTDQNLSFTSNKLSTISCELRNKTNLCDCVKAHKLTHQA